MANENLIARVNDPEKFFKLKSLVGKVINNDGESIANELEGLVVEGTLIHMGSYRFWARNIVDNSEIEIVTRPTTVEGTQIEILVVNVYGFEVR